MIKNLIFYWYIPKSINLPDIYQLHIYNLKKYSKIFDNATFILAIDDLADVNKIKATKSIIETLGFKCPIKYLIYKNDSGYRECIAFYNELVVNLKNLEGITFFGHTKGITRNLNRSTVPMWNTGLYYFNLNDIKSVEKELSKSDIFCYGTFKKKYSWILTDHDKIYKQKYNWHFSGTFFWIDSQKISKYIEKNKIEISMDLHRWYSEMWLGNIMDSSHAYTKYEVLGDDNLYEDCDSILEYKMKVPTKELNAFIKYFNKMNSEIGIDFNCNKEKNKSTAGFLSFFNPNIDLEEMQETQPKGLKKLIFK